MRSPTIYTAADSPLPLPVHPLRSFPFERRSFENLLVSFPLLRICRNKNNNNNNCNWTISFIFYRYPFSVNFSRDQTLFTFLACDDWEILSISIDDSRLFLRVWIFTRSDLNRAIVAFLLGDIKRYIFFSIQFLRSMKRFFLFFLNYYARSIVSLLLKNIFSSLQHEEKIFDFFVKRDRIYNSLQIL